MHEDRRKIKNMLLFLHIFAFFSVDQNQKYQDDNDMMMFRFPFTNVFDNYNRGAVYNAMLAFSGMSFFSSELTK